MNDVILREPTDDDIPIFFEHQRDPIACHMVPFMSRDPNDEPAFTAHWTTILTNDTVTKRTVLCGDQIVGYIVSFIRDEKLEVGYWIGGRFWGKGIATTALRSFLAEMTTRPLYAQVVNDNIASIKVLKKCGFTPCGSETSFAQTRGEVVEETIFIIL